MNIAGYLEEISRIYRSGDATEHSYRAPLQRLFESIDASAKLPGRRTIPALPLAMRGRAR